MKTSEKRLLDQLLADARLTDPRWIAYIMATVKHETNHRFEPVEEAYWLSDDWRRKNLRYYPAHGRGFVQITWPENYEKMSYRLNIPKLATNYDLALRWDEAYEILVVGMLEGLFTGRDLDDYINEDHCDYYRARKIVNGMDKADLIAGYARDYEERIRAEGTRFTDEPPTPDDTPSLHGCVKLVLREGNRGTCVRHLQRAFNGWTADAEAPVTVDGVFGPKTHDAITTLQFRNGLATDGIVGPETWKALEEYT